MDVMNFKDRADRINAMQRKTLRDLLELAKACADEMKNFKSRKDKEDFLPLLDMSESSFSKYAKIGNKQILHTNEFIEAMPATFEVVRLLSDQADDKLKQWLNENKLHKRMIARDILKLTGQTDKEGNQDLLLMQIFAAKDAPAKEIDAFLKEVEDLQSKYEIRFKNEKSEKLKREKAQEKYHKLFTDYVRKGALRHIAAMKARHNIRHRSLRPTERKQKWGFKDEELALEKGSDLERIKNVLHLVGSTDLYERLFEEASNVFENVFLQSMQPLLSEVSGLHVGTQPEQPQIANSPAKPSELRDHLKRLKLK